MVGENPRVRSLPDVHRRKTWIAAGLISGTSADGVDAALVKIRTSGRRPGISLLAFRTYRYPPKFKKFLLRNSDPSTARLDEISGLNILIAEYFSRAVKRLARSAGIPVGKIDVIGSHGQTIGHYPDVRKMFGVNVSSTFQIGHPSHIAKRTGITTVGDFRQGDVALGGSGAPLVPLFDYLLHRSAKINRGLLNIGGIANITAMARNADPESVIAFDTGPGNMLIDTLTDMLYGLPFDRNGRIAASGEILPDLLRLLRSHPYLRLRPPKSTGRETFGERYALRIRRSSRGRRKADIIATVTEFTALSVFLSYLQHVRKKIRLDELIVSGGGSENPLIMEALRRYFDPVRVLKAGDDGIPSEAKEAVCFALLGVRTLLGRSGNIPSVTGAERPGILGVIAPP